MGQVKIGREFFVNIKKDYANWVFAFTRELMQNAIDAKSKNISVSTNEEAEGTVVVFEDDGCGMTADIITDKFLTLGGSLKAGGSVGGFGVAKSIIAFAHRRYKIETQDIIVEGSGADYDISTSNKFLNGTRFTIVLEGTTKGDVENAFASWMGMSKWEGMFTINGEHHNMRLNSGFLRKSYDWCKIYTSNIYNSRAIIRINGMCMFTHTLTIDKTVILELEGNSIDLLTANRDNLQSTYAYKFQNFINGLAADSKNVLRANAINLQYWDGAQHYCGPTAEAARATIAVEAPGAAVSGISSEIPEIKPNRSKYSFMLRNETNLEIPDYMTLNAMSKWNKKLLICWTNVLYELHQILEVYGSFGVGFVISDSACAMYSHDKYGHQFLINPVEFTRFNSMKRSSKWGFTGCGKYALIEAAVHEMTHRQGCPYHDETFAIRFGENMIKVMQNLKKFHTYFKQ